MIAAVQYREKPVLMARRKTPNHSPNAIDARLVPFLGLLRRLALEEQAADVPRDV